MATQTKTVTPKTPAKTIVKKTAIVSKQNRKRFFYLRTKGARFGFLSAKVTDLAEAQKVHGLKPADVVESKELSTNRHNSVVTFCDMLDAIGEAPNPAAPVKTGPLTPAETLASTSSPATPTSSPAVAAR